MIRLALRNGVGVAVVVLIVTIFGLISLTRVPIQMTPDLTTQTVSVQTSWPGATPQDVEQQILTEQEKYLRSIPDLDKMTSVARTGSAEVTLEFRVGTSLEEILVRVNNALSQVPSYPENVDQPRLVTSNVSDQPIAWFSVKPLPGYEESIDIIAMQDFLEDFVQTEFERTPGVSQSEVRGGAARQVRVYVDPARLAERDISVGELRAAIRARNRDLSGGDFDEGKRRYLVRTLGRYESVSDIEGTLIARRDGAPVYLRDVATVSLGRAEQRVSVRHNGTQSVAMNVRRQPGTNIIEVMDEVRATVDRLNAGLLKDNNLYITQVSDNTIYIRESVALVRQNLLIGACLVTLMLLVFLRQFRPTFIGAMAVPICAVAAFLGLTIAGRTINVISLAGVAFAIGMTVDNSIVVLENIDRHRSMRKPVFQAAYDGVREVWSAVLASTLTTVFVFLPIVFVQEEAGQLFADIAIAITAAILASMLVSITVIPTTASRLLRPMDKIHYEGWRRRVHDLFGVVKLANLFAAGIMKAIDWLFHGVVRRVALIVIMAGGALTLAYFLAPQTEYLPDGRQNLLFGVMVPPPGYNLQEMGRIGDRMESFFLPFTEAEPEDFAQGRSDIPAIKDFFFISASQNLFILARTKDPRQLDDLVPHLNARINNEPGMIGFINRASIFSQGLGGSRAIDIDITGYELPVVYDLALQGFGDLRERFPGGQVRPEPGLRLGQPFLEVIPDWERAAELGISTPDLGYLVWALTDGAFLDEFYLQNDKVDMWLYSSEGTVNHTQDLENLLLYTAAGGTVPLSSIATVREVVNTDVIRRVDRERAVTLSLVPPTDMSLEAAVDIVESEIIPGLMTGDGNGGRAFPPGVNARIAGASDKLAATREALLGNFILALVISYLLMVALFKHWGYPLVIMMSVPLGMLGGLLGLHLMNHGGDYFGWLGIVNINQPLDVLTMLGFIILIGTVVNNPILIVEQSLVNIREGGMDYIAAVRESTRTRIRPIMMSVTTTSMGLSPLVFLPGSGAELYRGLGTVVLFGLFFSALFTLTFIPSLLSLMLQLRERVIAPLVESVTQRDESVSPATGSTGSQQPVAEK